MDIAKALVKCVARAFYETRHILVLDALMIHNALRDDELARLLGMVTKDLHKLCGKLKEDRMLSVHSRPEQKDGQQRPVNRTYYYIEFRSTIDGIKYRVYKLAELVRRSVNNGAETKGYVCPRCSKRFALLDALSLDTDDMDLFLCDRCSNALIEDEESTETKLGHEKIQRMNRQIEKIERFLREVDQVQIPFNDFDYAIANSVPIPKDRNQLPSAQSVPVTSGKPGSGPTRQNAQQSIEISITSSSEKTTEELKAEQARKQQQAEKNALPVWHTKSTVQPGAVTNAGLKEAAERAARERDGVGIARKEAEAAEEKIAAAAEESSGGDAIAQYYAALAAEKARQDAEDAEEEEDTDEEEEDEEADFEDLDVSGTVTQSAVTPVGESEEDEHTPPLKRVKIEPPTATTTIITTTQIADTAAQEDSEEEVDFEDV